MRVTPEAARRFLVDRHFLAPPRALRGRPASVLDVMRKLGSIQFDPVAVAGRNHDLMLHARVAGYEPAWCDKLYERREIFETTNKALSFVPAEEFPWYRVNAGRKGPRVNAGEIGDVLVTRAPPKRRAHEVAQENASVQRAEQAHRDALEIVTVERARVDQATLLRAFQPAAQRPDAAQGWGHLTPFEDVVDLKAAFGKCGHTGCFAR